MEASGIKFFNAAGAEQDCLQVLKGVGIDSIRFRVWVNPTGGWCGRTMSCGWRCAQKISASAS